MFGIKFDRKDNEGLVIYGFILLIIISLVFGPAGLGIIGMALFTPLVVVAVSRYLEKDYKNLSASQQDKTMTYRIFPLILLTVVLIPIVLMFLPVSAPLLAVLITVYAALVSFPVTFSFVAYLTGFTSTVNNAVDAVINRLSDSMMRHLGNTLMLAVVIIMAIGIAPYLGPAFFAVVVSILVLSVVPKIFIDYSATLSNLFRQFSNFITRIFSRKGSRGLDASKDGVGLSEHHQVSGPPMPKIKAQSDGVGSSRLSHGDSVRQTGVAAAKG